LGALGLFLGPGQRGQQQGREYGNDGDDHQQLNQREAATARARASSAAAWEEWAPFWLC
jgi:hypothetical protein